MSAAFSGKEATANYICAYVRGVLRGGFLHTTSERGEGYIAYKLPDLVKYIYLVLTALVIFGGLYFDSFYGYKKWLFALAGVNVKYTLSERLGTVSFDSGI